MKRIGKIVFFLSLLFIASSINAQHGFWKKVRNNTVVQTPVISGTIAQHEKSELEQLDDVFHLSFRLTENATACFHPIEQTVGLFQSIQKNCNFSSPCYRYYVTNRLNNLPGSPLYLHHRRLRI